MIYFVNFPSADAAVKVFIERKLEIFNEVLQEIEGAGIGNYLGSLHRHFRGEREGEEPPQREMRGSKKGGTELSGYRDFDTTPHEINHMAYGIQAENAALINFLLPIEEDKVKIGHN